ncbi:MAG: ABC transporter ATP-binding protein, partial [Oscillospiraceae bacterium]
MIEIKGFSKAYNEKKAVDDLNLTIEKGELYGFIGHNGAGKTTTLKAIAGILSFSQGDITVGGHSIKQEPLAAKQIMAYIPDNPDIYGYMTGIKYLNFVCDVYGVSAQDRQSKINEYSQAFELDQNLNDPVSSYSHGMKQKLAIIAAFAHSPKVLILDEPFVGLDPKASHTLKQYMRRLCDEGGCIFFS